MAEQELGATFAIHGGGSDLVFPHHENEIAQSEAAGRPFARIWMHNGMIETDAEKMSKSEGNIFQLSEALDRYGREAVVAYLISGHYRQPLGFRRGADGGSGCQGRAVAELLSGEPGGGAGEGSPDNSGEGPADPSPGSRLGGASGRRLPMTSIRRGRSLRFLSWSVKRIGVRWTGARRLLRWRRCSSWSASAPLLSRMRVLRPTSEAQKLMEEREEARAAKDFERADELRDRLAELGWTVRDSAEGPAWCPRS